MIILLCFIFPLWLQCVLISFYKILPLVKRLAGQRINPNELLFHDKQIKFKLTDKEGSCLNIVPVLLSNHCTFETH